MERPARAEVAVDLTLPAESLEVPQTRAHPCELLRPHRRSSEAGGEAFQAEPRRGDLLEVLAAETGDRGATRVADLDQAGALELDEAEPYRRLRDAEPFGEVALDERCALGELTGDDEVPQRLRDSVFDRRPSDGRHRLERVGHVGVVWTHAI